MFEYSELYLICDAGQCEQINEKTQTKKSIVKAGGSGKEWKNEKEGFLS